MSSVKAVSRLRCLASRQALLFPNGGDEVSIDRPTWVWTEMATAESLQNVGAENIQFVTVPMTGSTGQSEPAESGRIVMRPYLGGISAGIQRLSKVLTVSLSQSVPESPVMG